MTKSRNINSAKHRWTDAEVLLLRQLYPDVPAADVAALLGLPVGPVYQAAARHGLKKSAAFYASDKSARIRHANQNPNMIASRFQPGIVPWNKGTKGLQLGGVQTQFKPGSKPRNWLPVGSYRITADGYLERKINDLPGNNSVRWHSVSRLVWAAVNGPVPKGHVIAFRPGCKTTKLEDITIDRLECISRGERARRNHPRSRSPELGRLVQLRGAITRQINKLSGKTTTTTQETKGATP